MFCRSCRTAAGDTTSTAASLKRSLRTTSAPKALQQVRAGYGTCMEACTCACTCLCKCICTCVCTCTCIQGPHLSQCVRMPSLALWASHVALHPHKLTQCWTHPLVKLVFPPPTTCRPAASRLRCSARQLRASRGG